MRLRVAAPLRWISPGILRQDDPPPPRSRYLLWVDALIRVPQISVHQEGSVLTRRTIAWPASPGRVFRLPASVFQAVEPGGGDVTISVRDRAARTTTCGSPAAITDRPDAAGTS